ncbi:hypothetical protein HYH03_006441 [Edaphochlamys debaryana]|uniref:Ankyrin repeat domain-containing protein n=1 Tax=Edaphochlamys debaryana TaxID=47281 RepID=A0A835Y2W0_9CHLO|nr:hypothetical protein HYH03_006441 [Edaphochlamys debaryana]|eukprot:KAG2495497.1 hypothetical protein HYH03_006441 [Edaphochlamys debaryana]
MWNADILERIAGFLPPNDVALGLRLLCRATALQFRGCSSVLLSQPVQPEAFARHWSSPEAVGALTLPQRRQLLALTARSGVLVNTQLAASHAGCTLSGELLQAAAEGGDLETVLWLHAARPSPWSAAAMEAVVAAAARCGHLHVVTWAVGAYPSISQLGPELTATAQAGHTDVVDWLLAQAGQGSCQCGAQPPFGWAPGSHAHQSSARATHIAGVTFRCSLAALHFAAALGAALGGRAQLLDRLLPGAGVQALPTRGQQAAADIVALLPGALQGLALGPGPGPPNTAPAGPPRASTSPPLDSGFPAVRALLSAAAQGCDLATFLRLLDTLDPTRSYFPGADECHSVLYNAAASTTPDWRDKVAFLLLDRGYCWGEHSWSGVMATRPTLERLAELREWLGGGSGLASGGGVTGASSDAWAPGPGGAGGGAAPRPVPLPRRGRMEALQVLLDVGAGAQVMEDAARHAAREGDLPMLTWLHSRGCANLMSGYLALLPSAARGGHLDVVAWLVETFGPAAPLTAGIFAAAAESGSPRLLTWLAERGCRWDGWAWVGAAAAGNGATLEWMVQRGMGPNMGDTAGEAYVRAAHNGDLLTLGTLRRLGSPWSPAGDTFTRAILSRGRAAPLSALRWLRDRGCPVSWANAAEAAAGAARLPGNLDAGVVVGWVAEQRGVDQRARAERPV